jgi:hypothetical protein
MGALFPQRPLTEETIAAYWELLGDMDGSLFAASVRQCIETCDWFPSIRQLRRSADEIAAAQIPDTFERMKAYPQLVTNPLMRSILTTDLSGVRAELEAQRDSERRLRHETLRLSGVSPEPRRLTAGE